VVGTPSGGIPITTTRGSFVLVLAGGRTVRVPPDFEDEALGRLLAVVDAR